MEGREGAAVGLACMAEPYIELCILDDECDAPDLEGGSGMMSETVGGLLLPLAEESAKADR